MQYSKRDTSHQSKFAFVIEKLPAEVAAEVADILTNLRTDKPYEVLRQAILHRTRCSEESRIKHLLTNLTLGTSKPSQLLRRMQFLLGSNTMSDTVLKQMWLDKLQPEIVRILAALTDEVDREKLALIADRIADTTPTRQISSVSPSDDLTPDFNNRLQLLTSKLQKLSTAWRNSSRGEVGAIQLPGIPSVDHAQRRVALATISMVIAGTMRCLARALKNDSCHVLSGTHSQLTYRETTCLAPIEGVGCQDWQRKSPVLYSRPKQQPRFFSRHPCTSQRCTIQDLRQINVIQANFIEITTSHQSIPTANVLCHSILDYKDKIVWTFTIADIEMPILGADYFGTLRLICGFIFVYAYWRAYESAVPRIYTKTLNIRFNSCSTQSKWLRKMTTEI